MVTRWWSQWGFRVSVISSLGANLLLGLLSGARRRSASGRWASRGHLVLVFVLWVAYQLAGVATTSAIGKLSLCGSDDVTDGEKQLVAFWAPFLLLHLGGPDNLSAYALEDNKLSLRTWFGMFGHILAVGYAIYNSYSSGGSRVLMAASVIVFFSGAVRYGERAYALWKANLDSMKEDVSSSSSSSSGKEKTDQREETAAATPARSWEEEKMRELRLRIIEKRKKQLIGDGEALLLAQDLLPVWRHAMVDSSVDASSCRQLASDEIIRSLEWESMCQVVEMELSLMYELLYTKAAVAHTCPGYLIRFVSPLATAAAASLFSLHGAHGSGGGGTTTTTKTKTRGSFVGISYALLAIAFVQDVVWLLRALGSTWTYGYLQQEQTPSWLRRHTLQHAGKGRWHSLNRSVLRLDPLRLLFGIDPVSYRRWSGTIGRYNLLHECTTTTTRSQQCPPGWLVSMAGSRAKERQYLSKLPQRAKKLLFERVKKILLEAIDQHKDDGSNNKAAPPDNYKKYSDTHYIMEDIRTSWGQKAFHLRNSKKVLFPELGADDDEAPKFGKEFEQDVLCWHIATCIVLPFIRDQQAAGIPAQSSQDHSDAIAVMSEYMMFLVAVRREMLPGLVLHSQFEVTQKALVELWDGGERAELLLREKDKAAARDDKEKLAMILRCLRTKQGEDTKHKWEEIKRDEGTRLLADAVELYRSLKLAGETPAARDRRKQGGKRIGKKHRRPPPVAELLEFIFNVWVDKLVYASVRCSRESHAKQLSAGGGDLTTVLWMVIQHAGPFRIGETSPIYIKGRPRTPDTKLPDRPPAPTPAPPQLFYPHYHPSVWPWPPPAWGPQYEKPGDEPDTAIAPPTAPPFPAPEEATEDEDEDDSDEEYNLPIEYVTLY